LGDRSNAPPSPAPAEATVLAPRAGTTRLLHRHSAPQLLHQLFGSFASHTPTLRRMTPRVTPSPRCLSPRLSPPPPMRAPTHHMPAPPACSPATTLPLHQLLLRLSGIFLARADARHLYRASRLFIFIFSALLSVRLPMRGTSVRLRSKLETMRVR